MFAMDALGSYLNEGTLFSAGLAVLGYLVGVWQGRRWGERRAAKAAKAAAKADTAEVAKATADAPATSST